MNDEIKEILDNFEKYEARYKLHNETQFIITYREIQILLDYITNLQQENERLKQNQVKTLNRIRDFINSSKCEITEGSYCNDKHSQYWTMFKQFAEELQDKIKGINTKDYVYIPKWREEELLNQEEQLEDYKSRCEKAETKSTMTNICCICGETFTGYGNNPWPVFKDATARCCDNCNLTEVIPARIKEIRG